MIKNKPVYEHLHRLSSIPLWRLGFDKGKSKELYNGDVCKKIPLICQHYTTWILVQISIFLCKVMWICPSFDIYFMYTH